MRGRTKGEARRTSRAVNLASSSFNRAPSFFNRASSSLRRHRSALRRHRRGYAAILGDTAVCTTVGGAPVPKLTLYCAHGPAPVGRVARI